MREVASGFGSTKLYLAVAAVLGSVACTGVVDGGKDSGDGTTTTDPDKPTPGGAAVKPGRGEMHRLNSTEYNNTVADVLGTTLKPADANWRGGEIEGFDNVASVLGVDATQFGLYLDAAEKLANDVFASPTLKAKFVTCSTADDAACVKDIISKAGLHIFRRPLRANEIATYQKVYTEARAQKQDHDGALKHVLWSLLSSAEFLYRIELPKGTGKRPLDGFELASRLSYFLWSSAPDDALLEAAANNALGKDTEVQAAVDRMLADFKSTRFTESFAGQFLGARKVAGHAVAPERFPMWTPAVASAAQNEMYLYFEEFLRNDRSWTEFLTADVNFVNTSLAPIYGMQNVTSADLMKVNNTADKRAGFLGLAGFLALTSMDRRTSPTLRGKWVLGNLLCREAPPPPANVPKLEVGGKDLDNGNVREILEAHRVRPDCAGCHAIFDPFGLAMEKYDAIGRYRDTYGDGSTINASTTLDGNTFEDLAGAANIVTSDPAFKSCITHKMFIYGLGRSPTGDDAAWIKELEEEWAAGNMTLKRLISGLVESVPFRNSGDIK
ncbi:MAG TPA: DUF1592 domain-containing protein [Polyangiaceae bacterium]|nr:DUF1592 domain-containing protein [Polyangiaceae bacterium]